MVSALHVFLFHIRNVDIYNCHQNRKKLEILAANEIFLTIKVWVLKDEQINLAHLFSIKNSIGKDLLVEGNKLQWVVLGIFQNIIIVICIFKKDMFDVRKCNWLDMLLYTKQCNTHWNAWGYFSNFTVYYNYYYFHLMIWTTLVSD